MPNTIEDSLCKLIGSSAEVVKIDAYPEPGAASVRLLYSEGTNLRADYWRLVRDRKEVVSSFDHQQKYGLPVPVDAVMELQKQLGNRTVTEARLHGETADLFFRFTGDVNLQIFGFSGYEVWEINFPDGTSEYSNYAK